MPSIGWKGRQWLGMLDGREEREGADGEKGERISVEMGDGNATSFKTVCS